MSLGRTLSLGDVFAGHRIKRVLGSGGMGVVYLAEDMELGRDVALKVLNPGYAQDQEFRERFRRERRVAASLRHPHIVSIYEAREAEGLLYITMEYIEGTDLKDVIVAEAPLALDRTLALLAPIADALDEAHEEGLVHRDVKPQNIMVGKQSGRRQRERSYLTDFGLAKKRESRTMTQAGTTMGTIDYMSPEQLSAQEVDGRSDLYSFGCVLYECLAGTVVYEGDSDPAVIAGHLMRTPPRISDKNPALAPLDAVVAKVLDKDPERRYASCGELVEVTRAAFGNPSQLTSVPATTVPPDSQDSKRTRSDDDAESDLPAYDQPTIPPQLSRGDLRPDSAGAGLGDEQAIPAPPPPLPPPDGYDTPRRANARSPHLLWAAGAIAALVVVAAGIWLLSGRSDSPSGGTVTEDAAEVPAVVDFEDGSPMAAFQDAGEISIGTRVDVPPFGFQDPDGERAGFEVDLGRYIADRLGVEPNFVDAATFGTSEGADIVLSTLTITTGRDADLDFSRPYYIATGRILVPEDSDIGGVDDLAGRRVCTLTGSTYHLLLQEDAPSSELLLTRSYSQCFARLQNATADAVVTDDSILAGMIIRDESLHMVGAPLSTEPYGIALPEGEAALQQFLDETIELAVEDGTWDRLFQEHVGVHTGEDPINPLDLTLQDALELSE